MRILGIDTTTNFFCLGIYDNGKVYEYNLESGRRLSVLLHITIKRALEAAGLDSQNIDYFACGLGPGSFTGVRIGLAAIKGLSWSLHKPLIGISTLDILAQDIKSENNPIVPAIDAKRNLIYCSFFKNKNGRLFRVRPYMLLSEEEFFKAVEPKAIVFGDAVSLHKAKILNNIRGVTILDRDYWYPKAHNILELAKEKIKNKQFDDPLDIKPIYLYPKECQVKVTDSQRHQVTS
jgi:tRNA threonylcarbamoyl adenosine modification protein YeaZ